MHLKSEWLVFFLVVEMMRGARYLMGDNLEVARAEFLTLSWAVLLDDTINVKNANDHFYRRQLGPGFVLLAEVCAWIMASWRNDSNLWLSCRCLTLATCACIARTGRSSCSATSKRCTRTRRGRKSCRISNCSKILMEMMTIFSKWMVFFTANKIFLKYHYNFIQLVKTGERAS